MYTLQSLCDLLKCFYIKHNVANGQERQTIRSFLTHFLELRYILIGVCELLSLFILTVCRCELLLQCVCLCVSVQFI